MINNRASTPLQEKNCALPLRTHIYGKLMITTMKILKAEFNLGCQENFWFFDATQILLLENVKLCT